MERTITLDEFIVRNETLEENTNGRLTRLLRDIGIAAKIVNRAVNRAGLESILGVAGKDNASGDQVQKLDLFTNKVFIDCLQSGGQCAGIASEENEEIILLDPMHGKYGNYVVIMDPLDGSSNIDVNVSVGTIFGIYKRDDNDNKPTSKDDFLKKGSELVAAGYVLYGTSTLLVYSTGKGVNGFTLDPTIGEFCLSHPEIKIPSSGNYYSVNQGYYLKFDLEMRRYIDHCSDSNLRLRYIGSMVSDLHRIMFQGGIFLYPNTRKYPQGKLRLTYECNPMSFIVEQAGGMAMNTRMERILDLEVKDIHQRSTIVIGSINMVKEMKAFVERYSAISI